MFAKYRFRLPNIDARFRTLCDQRFRNNFRIATLIFFECFGLISLVSFSLVFLDCFVYVPKASYVIVTILYAIIEG